MGFLGLDDIYAELIGMSRVRQNAVCFALFANVSLEKTVYLRWSDSLPTLDHRALHMLDQVETSNETDLVFWEGDDQGSAVPLYSLSAHFTMSTMGRSWGEFVGIYSKAAPIDFETDYGKMAGL